jgi:hypothetical protein
VVLADALAEVGDARGELMQLQLALDAAPPVDYDPIHRTRALVRPVRDPCDAGTLERHVARELRLRALELREARGRALLGQLAEHRDIELEFRYGLLDRVRLVLDAELPLVTELPDASSIAHVLAQILASPEARMLRTIEIDPRSCAEGRPIRQLVDWLGSRGIAMPTSLRTLVLGTTAHGQDYQYVDFEGEPYEDDLSTVLTAFPDLQELWVNLATTKQTWVPLVSEHLRHVTYLSPYVTADQLRVFAQSSLPSLASFVLWTGASYYINHRDDIDRETEPYACVTHADLEPVFAMLDRCPELRLLGIGNYAGDVTALVAALAAHPCAARIETLDLSYADQLEGARLAPELARFTSLRELVIDQVKVTMATRRALELPTRTVTGDDPYESARYRYVVHQE